MAYPTTAELVAGSTVSELTGLSTEQKDAKRAEAIAAVESYCRQSFTLEGTEEDPAQRIIDGSGSGTLYLPKRLVTLTELVVPGGGIGAGDVELSEDRDRLAVRSESTGGSWATRPIAAARGAASEPTFPAGLAAVAVTGVWGWADDEYPGEVTTALRFHMEDRALADAHALSGSVRAARGLGIAGISQGNLSADLSRGEPAVSTRVRRLLQRHRWTRPVGALA